MDGPDGTRRPDAPTVLSGGLVLTAKGAEQVDVLIDRGRVAGVGGPFPALPHIDCSGCWVGPGFVDLHTHLREPGQEHKEDMASGALAGAAGGYTALLAMPNTNPAIDTKERARWAMSRARGITDLEIRISGAVTASRAGRDLADLEGMLAAGVRWFTDDGDPVATSELVAEALTALEPYEGVLSEHCEDREQTAGGIMNAGEVSQLLGVKGMPPEAESRVAARDLAVARQTGGRLHIQHVSTAATVDLVAAAKAEGLPITAEVTPHHLTFDDAELKTRDPRFKMKPPLRSPADVRAVRAGLVAGVIDAVATDHAPHSHNETEAAGLEAGAFGVIGLETAAAAVLTATDLGIDRFFDRLSIAPARLGGFRDHGNPVAEGIAANLVVFDPQATWRPHRFRSRSRNSPFIGRPLRGRVRATFYQGTNTFGDAGG